MYFVSIDISRTEAKEVQFIIPDFLKKYVDDADCCEDYIFEYSSNKWDTKVKEYQKELPYFRKNFLAYLLPYYFRTY